MKKIFFSKALEILHISSSKSRSLDYSDKPCYFQLIPKELRLLILSFLPTKEDLFNARLVCKEWSIVCKMETAVWTNFIIPIKTIKDPTAGEKPTPRVCHSAVVHEDSMIIFGGHTGSTFSFGNILDCCWKLDFPTRTWHRLGGSFVHNTEHTAVVHNGNMYIFGGYYRNYSDDLYCYNFKTETYQLVQVVGAVKPRRRSACVAVIYNDQLWVYGGWDGVYGGNHNDMHFYDFKSNQWTQVQYSTQFVPPPLRSVNGVVYKDALYCHGGFGDTHPEGLFKFDFITKEWSVVKTTGPAPGGRSRSKMAGYKHFIYVMGGWDRTHYYADYYEFNVLTSEWKKLDKSTPPIGQHSMVVYNDALYTFGGFFETQNKPVNTVMYHKLS